MAIKSIVIISNMVDATIKEYQPDVDFKMFKSIDSFNAYLERDAIRADVLFFTNDVVGGSASSFSYLKDIILLNDFLKVDRVIYITEERSPEISAFNYLVEDQKLDNWELIQGSLNRSFVTEIINGTFREDIFDMHRKVVIRRPRADYVKEQLKSMDSMEEEYVDDDHYLTDIPTEYVTERSFEERETILQQVYIAGTKCKERTAFALLAAQYLSCTDKVLIIESDPEYHLLTEYVTKAKIPCSVVTITDIYEDLSMALHNIQNAKENLVVIECIDRINYSYTYMTSLLYYNLVSDFKYFVTECDVEDIPNGVSATVVIPSTITDLLETCEMLDKSVVQYCSFVGVDMNYLPETHVSSGTVMSKLLCDVLSESQVLCPVIAITSLRLGETPYDLGGVLGKGVLL